MNKDGGVDLNKMDDEERKKPQLSGIQLPDLSTLAKEGKKEKVYQKIAPMSEEQQCYELVHTVRCRLAPSKVHGVGVFALRDIKKGERCHVMFTSEPTFYRVHPNTLRKYVGDIYPEIYQMILDRWPNAVNGHPFLSPNFDQRLISFMNHSDTPNFKPESDTALRDIKAGEELFEDYRVVPNWEKAFPFLVPNDTLTPKGKGRGKIGA